MHRQCRYACGLGEGKRAARSCSIHGPSTRVWPGFVPWPLNLASSLTATPGVDHAGGKSQKKTLDFQRSPPADLNEEWRVTEILGETASEPILATRPGSRTG